MKTKQCSKCEVVYPATVNWFYREKQHTDNLRSACKSCDDARLRRHRLNHKKEHKSIVRKSRLKCRYGITIEKYNLMFEIQRGCCGICDIHQSKLSNKLSVDHNHKTGKVRGLLCSKCNAKLGVLENEFFVLTANDYLKKYGEERA